MVTKEEKARVKHYEELYPGKKWTVKNTRPLKTALLKMVRKGLIVRRDNSYSIPLFTIENTLSKVSFGEKILVQSIENAKLIVREQRIAAAYQIARKKRKEIDTTIVSV